MLLLCPGVCGIIDFLYLLSVVCLKVFFRLLINSRHHCFLDFHRWVSVFYVSWNRCYIKYFNAVFFNRTVCDIFSCTSGNTLFILLPLQHAMLHKQRTNLFIWNYFNLFQISRCYAVKPIIILTKLFICLGSIRKCVRVSKCFSILWYPSF